MSSALPRDVVRFRNVSGWPALSPSGRKKDGMLCLRSTLHCTHAAAFVHRAGAYEPAALPACKTAPVTASLHGCGTARRAVWPPARLLASWAAQTEPCTAKLEPVLASTLVPWRAAHVCGCPGPSTEAPGRPQTPLRGPRSTDPLRGDGSPPSWSQWRATLGPLGRGISPKWRATHRRDDHGPTGRPRDAPRTTSGFGVLVVLELAR